MSLFLVDRNVSLFLLYHPGLGDVGLTKEASNERESLHVEQSLRAPGSSCLVAACVVNYYAYSLKSADTHPSSSSRKDHAVLHAPLYTAPNPTNRQLLRQEHHNPHPSLPNESDEPRQGHSDSPRRTKTWTKQDTAEQVTRL